MPAETGERRAYRVAEVAEMLGVPRSTVYDAIGRGCMRAVKLGGVLLIPAEELDRLLSGPEAESTTASAATMQRRGRRG